MGGPILRSGYADLRIAFKGPEQQAVSVLPTRSLEIFALKGKGLDAPERGLFPRPEGIPRHERAHGWEGEGAVHRSLLWSY